MSSVEKAESHPESIEHCTTSGGLCEGSEQCLDDPNKEPCPTPLNWQQVVATFRDTAKPTAIEVGGHTISCRSYGTGQPLLFVNGSTGDSDLYSLLAYVLGDEFECLFFDPPDVLKSGRILSTLPEMLEAVADHFGHQRFDVFASGFGSITALPVALDAGRIRKLVLQSGFAHRSVTWTEKQMTSLFRKSARTVSRLPLWDRINQRNHRMWFPPFDFSRWEFLHENTGQTVVSRIAWQIQALLQFDIRDRLPEIECPTLLIATEGDGRILEASHEILQAGLPNATVESMHNTGQFAFLTHPHRLRKQLREFLLNDN